MTSPSTSPTTTEQNGVAPLGTHILLELSHCPAQLLLEKELLSQTLVDAATRAGATVVITSDPTLPARSGGYFGDLMDLIERDILGPLA